MLKQLSEHQRSELKRISKNALAAREVFQHAVGEAFLRFERNIDSNLARDIVAVLNSRQQAAEWMAGLDESNDTPTAYEIYLAKGSDGVREMLEARKSAIR